MVNTFVRDNRVYIVWQEEECRAIESRARAAFFKAVAASSLFAGITVSDDFKTISFFGNKICMLREHSASDVYNRGILIAKYLGQQLFHLEKKGYIFPWVSADDILVIDDSQFLFLGLGNLMCLEKGKGGSRGKVITFTEPFSLKSHFLSPEIRALTLLPSSVDHRAVYYSLGILIRDSLGAGISLDNILETKLYWFLLRCLDTEPERRFLLFV